MVGSKFKAIIAVIIGLGLLAVLVQQTRTLQRLRGENARLTELAAIAEARSDQATQASNGQRAPGELEQLRADHAELLRLRGEVSALRKQMKEARGKPRSQTAKTASSKPEETNEPVQIFLANAS